MNMKDYISKFRYAKLMAIIGIVFCGLSVVAQAAGIPGLEKYHGTDTFLTEALTLEAKRNDAGHGPSAGIRQCALPGERWTAA